MHFEALQGNACTLKHFKSADFDDVKKNDKKNI